MFVCRASWRHLDLSTASSQSLRIFVINSNPVRKNYPQLMLFVLKDFVLSSHFSTPMLFSVIVVYTVV